MLEDSVKGNAEKGYPADSRKIRGNELPRSSGKKILGDVSKTGERKKIHSLKRGGSACSGEEGNISRQKEVLTSL